MPRSTFYYQLKYLNDEDKHAEEKEVIAQIFKENKGRYGYRRITMEMYNRGYFINHKTVRKLMHACGIKCEIEAYIDYYNNRRIKCKLKGLSPIQYRIQSSRAAK